LWDFIEPVLTPAVKQAEERARALKEEADRLEAEAKARQDAEAEAQAREQQRIAAEQLEQARKAAELQAQAEALAKQQAEAEAQKKAAEALKLAKASKSKLGPNRASNSSNSSNVTSSAPKKKRNKGTPMALGLANVGGYLGRQTITGHATFVLNLFYTLNNNPPYNQIHVHLDSNDTVVYVSMKYTGQQGNGQHVASNSALFAEAAQRAARDK
jgi:multidrug efflux pump subunit AcrA (membrane-fusion protein)